MFWFEDLYKETLAQLRKSMSWVRMIGLILEKLFGKPEIF